MFAKLLASQLSRAGIHYGWVMVALAFMSALCSSAATTLLGVLIVPITAEFGWTRGDVSAGIAAMFILIACVAPFAGALLLRYGLMRIVATSCSFAMIGLLLLTGAKAPWQLIAPTGILIGTAAGLVGLTLNATVASSVVCGASGPRRRDSDSRVRSRATHVPAVSRVACHKLWLADSGTAGAYRQRMLRSSVCIVRAKLALRPEPCAIWPIADRSSTVNLDRRRDLRKFFDVTRGKRVPDLLGIGRHLFHLRAFINWHRSTALHSVLRGQQHRRSHSRFLSRPYGHV